MKKHLLFDKTEFAETYPKLPFAVKHNLSEHPLFELPRLLELCKTMPAHKVDFYTGRVGVNEDRLKTDPTGLTAEETIEQIGACKSWMVLKNVELDPEYNQLLNECLAEVQPLMKGKTTGVNRYQGWVFITSPGSIAPYHLDPEHNFLLQIRGPKVIHIFDAADRSIISEAELEKYYSGGAADAKLEYLEKYEEKVYKYRMGPGDGAYIPVSAPHWVKVEDDISVSFSITYYCDEVYRRDRLYRFNAKLRRMGLNPTPYGQSTMGDAIKNGMVQTYLNTRKLFGYKPPPLKKY